MCDTADTLTVRPARDADRLALVRLAQLDSAVPVFDVALVAQRGGRIVAAVTPDGAALANPFEHTAALVEFMRAQAAAPAAVRARSASAYRRRSRRYWRAKPATNAGL